MSPSGVPSTPEENLRIAWSWCSSRSAEPHRRRQVGRNRRRGMLHEVRPDPFERRHHRDPVPLKRRARPDPAAHQQRRRMDRARLTQPPRRPAASPQVRQHVGLTTAPTTRPLLDHQPFRQPPSQNRKVRPPPHLRRQVRNRRRHPLALSARRDGPDIDSVGPLPVLVRLPRIPARLGRAPRPLCTKGDIRSGAIRRIGIGPSWPWSGPSKSASCSSFLK